MENCGLQGSTVQVKSNTSEDIQECGGVGQAAEYKSFSKAAASCGLREQDWQEHKVRK